MTVSPAAAWNDFKGAAKRLDDIDIPRIGHRIGVGEDEIHAFMDVETSGSGFDKVGRPKMLFEPHKFYQKLSGKKLDAAVKAGLAYKKWKKTGYPKDSYPRLIAAMAIDEDAALQSASWGLGQVMGENFAMAAYKNVQEMVRAFMEDEELQLDAMVSFIISAGIDDDLRAHRWATVVRVYNGPGQVAEYTAKLEKAFRRWQKIADTPWSPEAATPATKEVIESVQQLLRDKGFPEVGEVDGKMGDRTRSTIETFQRYAEVPITGRITDELIALLVKYPGRPQAPARAKATDADLKGTESVDLATTVKKVGVAITGASGVGALADGWIESANKFKSLSDTIISISPWVLGAVAGIGAIYFGSKIIRAQVLAYREGRQV